MRSVFFTKPKRSTCAFLSHMIEQGEDVLSVVVDGKGDYDDAELFRICRSHGVPVADYADCDGLFEENEGAVEMIWCNTFPKLIKEEWIRAASVAAVNFHSAPLPEYRGVFAFNFAILNGDGEYGVTAHLLGKKFD